MDADTRHQLKQNELAEFLAKIRDLRDPKSLYTLAAVGAVLVGIVAWYGWKYTRQHATEEGWQRLAKITVALVATSDDAGLAGAQTDLRGMIQETTDPLLAGYARLCLARSRVDQAFQQPAQRQEAFEEAADLLGQIRSNPETPPMLAAAASFLLASTRESLWQIDEAKELYHTLAEDPRYDGSPYKTLSGARLADMDVLATHVAFEPGDPPPPSEPPPEEAQSPPTLRRAELTPEMRERFRAATQRAQAMPTEGEPSPAGSPTETPPAPQPSEPAPADPEPASEPPKPDAPDPGPSEAP